MARSSAATATGSQSHALGIALLLCVATGVVYAPVLDFPFVDLDDPLYVPDNPHVRDGVTLETIRWAFTSYHHAANWHPVTWLSHALDVQLFGLEAAGHHATSILVHAINALLVFGLLRSATGQSMRAALVAALFALHPLRVESVAWVAERKDVLSAFFGLLAIWAWSSYSRRGGLARFGLVAAFHALALMSKPMLVTLPGVLLLLDYWPLGRTHAGASARRHTWGRLVLEKLPLLALSAGSGAIALVAQSGTAMDPGAQIPLGARLANAVVSDVRYLGKSFWPSDLVVLYPHPYLPGGRPWAVWQVAGALALLIAISAALFRLRRPALIAGWLWYLGTLVPAIGLVQVGYQAMADRYTYFPSIGLWVLVVWGVAEWVEARRRYGRLARALATGLAVCAIAILMVRSRFQIQPWRDSLALYTHATRSEPVSPIVFLGRANTHSSAGAPEQALADLERALALDPKLAAAYNNRGVVYRDRGDHALARADLDRALQIDPKLIVAYVNRAQLFRLSGSPDRALADYAAALAIEPSAPLHIGRGQLLHEQGKCAEALASHAMALELDEAPAARAEAHKNLAWVLATCADPEHRDGPRARTHAERACELSRWRDSSCIGVLAAAHAEAGDFAAARRLVQQALEQTPDAAQPMLREMLRDFESDRAYRVRAP